MTETPSAYEMVQKHRETMERESSATDTKRKINEALFIVIAQVELLADLNSDLRSNEMWHATQAIIEHARNDHF